MDCHKVGEMWNANAEAWTQLAREAGHYTGFSPRRRSFPHEHND